MEVWKCFFFYNPVVVRFHVNLPGRNHQKMEDMSLSFTLGLKTHIFVDVFLILALRLWTLLSCFISLYMCQYMSVSTNG